MSDLDPTATLSSTGMGRLADLVESIEIKAGDYIGPYRIVESIGQGGFGIVYLAEQTEPVRRRVALKVVKPGMDTREVLTRFAAERQALALIDHPNVARIFDAGLSDQGRPYFVMEFVPGEMITQFAEKHALSTRERVELFIPICHAVQHAHQKGIIHRDLKPSNILVTIIDGVPTPKVIDFGIAKAAAEPLADGQAHTIAGRLLGTPEYMSPEQAGPDQHDIDTRTDIYSLGVVLYELLTGLLPFDLPDSGREAVLQLIREREPVRSSVRILSSAPGRRKPRAGDPRIIARELRGDLDWITLRALEKDRARRYETANALALDLRRHTHQEPVLAGPPGASYRFSRFARRNRGPLIAGAAVLLTLVGGLVASALGFIQARQERDKALDSKRAAIAAADAAKRQFERAVAERDRADRERENARSAAADASEQRGRVALREADLEQERYRLHIARANLALSRADVGSAKAELWSCPKELRHWEWYYLAGLLDQSAGVLYAPGRAAQAAVYAPDGAIIITGGRDITLWDAQSFRPLRSFGDVLSESPTAQYRSLAVSPDGSLLVSARILDDHIQAWRLETGELVGSVPVFEPDARPAAGASRASGDVHFSPDGSEFVVSGWVVRTFDAGTLARLRDYAHGGYVRCVAYSPDGALLATAGNDARLRIWSRSTGEQIRVLSLTDPAWSLAFSPDSAAIAVGGQTRPTAHIFDVASGQVKQVMVGEGAGAMRLAFHPEGTAIAATSSQGIITVWSARTGAVLITMLGDGAAESGIAFSPDGARLVTPSWRGYARVWDVSGIGLPAIDWFSEDSPRFTSISRGGDRMISFGPSGPVLWNLAGRKPETSSLPHPAAKDWYAVSSPDGTLAATFGRDGTMKLWSAKGELIRDWPPSRQAVVGAAFAPAPGGMVLVRTGGGVEVYGPDPDSPARFSAKIETTGLAFAAFSEDGSTVAVATQNEVRAWETATGREIFKATPKTGARAACIAFSPDGARLAAFWENGAGATWRLPSGEELFTLPGRPQVRAAHALSFSADGDRLLVLGSGFGGANALRLLETSGGREAFSQDIGRGDRYVAATFSGPDRERIVAVTSLGGVRVLDARPGRDRERLMDLRDRAKELVDRTLASQRSVTLNNDRDLFTRDRRSRAMEAVLDTIRADVSLPDDLRRAAIAYMIESETR